LNFSLFVPKIELFIYNQSLEVIVDEVNQVHHASLKQFKMSIDTMLQQKTAE